jgi:methylglutaconyl-CoA hydratase
MSDLLIENNEGICSLILNRTSKHNAFDDELIEAISQALATANADEQTRVILLRANGKSFSAGADLNWMRSMKDYSEQENFSDSLKLAKLMHDLHTSPKPTIACVQGAAFGGGAGLVASCDIALGSKQSKFCFSEVKLGLIPAVISPYVVAAIGQRHAKYYFLTAELINASKALEIGLLHSVVEEHELLESAYSIASTIKNNAPAALEQSKQLIDFVNNRSIDDALIEKTAQLIAKIRISDEGQDGLNAFLTKQKPKWIIQ